MEFVCRRRFTTKYAYSQYVGCFFDLNNTELQIKLMQGATVIDVAWDGTAPSEGIFDTTPGSEKYYSTERISTPSNGANPLEWYTTIDAASTNDFFDGGVDERGTPGAKNRPENEPLAHQKLQVRDTVTATESAAVVEQEVIPEFTDVVGASEAAILEEPAHHLTNRVPVRNANRNTGTNNRTDTRAHQHT